MTSSKETLFVDVLYESSLGQKFINIDIIYEQTLVVKLNLLFSNLLDVCIKEIKSNFRSDDICGN